MKTMLYTGAFRFPEGDAAAFRVQGVARLFVSFGFDVSFAGWERRQGEEHYIYQGYNCYPQAEFREEKKSKIGRFAGFLFRGFKTLRWMKLRQFDVVVVYNPPALFALRLLVLSWCSKFTLVLDSTEWYEADHLPGGKFGVAALENWVRMNVIYPRFNNVICISRFLERYYSPKNVIRIPPLVSVLGKPLSVAKSIGSELKFIYAGEAGKKDQILDFIRVLPALSDQLDLKIVFTIMGQEWDALVQLLEDHGIAASAYAPFVRCLGRVNRHTVGEEYKSAHFSILFREDRRYAHAGFPTKAMESWSYGCPIICNRVGDLGNLADDHGNALVINPLSIEAELLEKLRYVIETDSWSRMSENSLRKSEDTFQNALYQSAFEVFLQAAGNCRKRR